MPAGWSRGQRWLHWATASLVAGNLALGWKMTHIPLSGHLLLVFLLYQGHKSVGLIVLLITMLRLALRLRRGRPPWPDDLPGWQRQTASAVHGLLYVLLLLTPALGYFVAATSPNRIPTLFLGVINIPSIVGASPAAFAVLKILHATAAFALLALALGHAGAALHNHRRGLPTLLLMLRGRP